MRHLLDTLDDELVREMVLEDFRRINDICEQKASTLTWASKLFQIQPSPNEALQGLAMRIFLDYPEAFEYAWTRYCIYTSSSKISRHNLPCQCLRIKPETLAAFEKELQSYFALSCAGEVCHVYHYDEDGHVILRVERGSYLRTVAHWEGRKVKVESFRPASEDVLIYERENGQLCIQTAYPTDMEQYIRSFTKIFIGNPSLADHPDRDKVYVLDPILTHKFNWTGNEFIKSVVPVEAKLKFKGATEVVMDIRSKDLRQTLEHDFIHANLFIVELFDLTFRFTIESRGKEEKVTFEIAPPFTTDLAKKKHAEIISAYLRENGVQIK